MDTNNLILNSLLGEVEERQLEFLSIEAIAGLPIAEMLVKGVLPKDGLAALYGPSGSGKTFLALDLVMAVSIGRPWFGNRCHVAPVLYICLEGAAGLAQRVQAYEVKHGRVGNNVKFLIEQWDLGKPHDVDALIIKAQEEMLSGGIIVIDTMNRASPGADENSSKDMGRLIEACSLIQHELGGLVLLVHHTGKDASRGLRGHSSLFAALDATIEVKRDGNRRSWRAEKQKDGAEGEQTFFRLDVIELDVDDDGDPVTSCIVVPEESPKEITRSKGPRGGNQKIIYDALGEYISDNGQEADTPAPATKYAVRLDGVVEAIARHLPVEKKRQKERTQKAITDLIANGFVECRDGWLWIK